MRCKMRLDSITTTHGSVHDFDAEGKKQTRPGEVMTLRFSPVYHNDDPNHENSKFWAYTPCGSIVIDTVNPKAVEGKKVGSEYYVDFHLVES